jgi:cytochrome c-type biogenesis protein CcmH
MNIVFWMLMVLMLLVAIALLVYPLLKAQQAPSLAYKDSNLKINDEKIKELDLDLKEGRIDQAFYKTARDELDRELLIDVPAENQETASQHYSGIARRHPALALMISVFIPALALLLYLELGMHSASEESFIASQQQLQQQQSQNGQSQGQPSVEEMASALEAKIAKEGGTVQDWTMLGRTHKYLKKYELAAKAFAVALETDTDNVQLMLESAEMMALSNNRLFTPDSRNLVLRAYALEPDDANVLWFAGVAEYQFGNYQQAIGHLTKLLPLVRNEDEVMKSVVSIVAKSREQLIAAGEEVPELEKLLGIKAMAKVDSPTESAKVPAPASTASRRLDVTVNVSAEVREKFKGSDVIFVYAKAKQGPRMPLAAQRMTLAELPATIVLDDSMGMVEGMNISAFDQLVVSARVTKSGAAIAQSGDYIGRIDVDGKAEKTALNVVIDTAIP